MLITVSTGDFSGELVGTTWTERDVQKQLMGEGAPVVCRQSGGPWLGGFRTSLRVVAHLPSLTYRAGVVIVVAMIRNKQKTGTEENLL